MAAGLSQKQISTRVRNRLQALASKHGGEYVPASGSSPAAARGVTGDGIEWSASFGISRASNGETFGIPGYDIRSGGFERQFSGLHGDLDTALNTFRAERDGSLVYVVAHGGGTGDELAVTEDAVTRDLGQARWAQQQTGNRANVWISRLAADGSVTFLREQGYTDPASIAAMGAYMAANGLDIYEAQRTLETNPALAVIDTRAPVQPESAPVPRI